MSRRVADLRVEPLQSAGVKTWCGVVGDTRNRIAHAIDRSEIDGVQMRHAEAGAFAASAEALLRLVTPPSSFVSPEAVRGKAVYSAKAVLTGKGHDVWEWWSKTCGEARL